MKKVLCALLCILLLLTAVGCSKKPSDNTSNPSSQASPKVSSTVSSTVSQQETPLLFQDITVVDICEHFVLDDQGSVYYFGRSEPPENIYYIGEEDQQRDFAKKYSSTTPKKGTLYKLDLLPEKMTDLFSNGAIGKSGKVYLLFYDTINFTGMTNNLAETLEERIFDLHEPIVKVASAPDDTLVLTASGKVYTIGGATVYYPMTKTKESFDKLAMLPLEVKIPEPMIDIAITTYGAFALGKSGRLYMAHRFYTGLGYEDSPIISRNGKFPSSLKDSVFLDTGVTGVKQIETWGGVIYLVKNDGSVWCCEHDSDAYEYYNFYTHPDHTGFFKPKFEKSDLFSEPIAELTLPPKAPDKSVNPHSMGYAKAASGEYYRIFTTSAQIESPQVEPIEEGYTPVATYGNILLLSKDKNYFVLGYDTSKLFLKKSNGKLTQTDISIKIP